MGLTVQNLTEIWLYPGSPVWMCNTPNFRIGSGLKFLNRSSDFWNWAGLENMDNKMKYRSEFFFLMKNRCVRKRAVSKTGYAISVWVYYARKFLVSVIEISNGLRLSRFHFHGTRFSETNNFRVEHFSKFASEGPQNDRFPKWPKNRGHFAIFENLFIYKPILP